LIGAHSFLLIGEAAAAATNGDILSAPPAQSVSAHPATPQRNLSWSDVGHHTLRIQETLKDAISSSRNRTFLAPNGRVIPAALIARDTDPQHCRPDAGSTECNRARRRGSDPL